MRGWISRSSRLASVVIMVQLNSSSPSGSCRASHRPAKTKGSPSNWVIR